MPHNESNVLFDLRIGSPLNNTPIRQQKDYETNGEFAYFILGYVTCE